MTAIHKQYVLSGLAMAMSLLYFFALNYFLVLPPAWLVLLAGVALSLFWVAVMAIALALLTIPWPSSLTIILPPLLLFAFGRSWPSAIAALLLFLAIHSARYWHRIRGWLHPRYRTAAVFGRTTYILLFGLVIIFAGLLLPKVIENLSTENITVSERVINVILAPFSGVISAYVPGYSPDATIDDLITAQLLSPSGKPDAASLEASRSQVVQGLEQKLQLPIAGQSSLPAIIAQAITRQLRQIFDTNPLVLIILLIASFLFLARALIFLAYYPAIVFVSLLVSLLMSLNFLQIHQVSVITEHLSLDPVASGEPSAT